MNPLEVSRCLTSRDRKGEGSDSRSLARDENTACRVLIYSSDAARSMRQSHRVPVWGRFFALVGTHRSAWQNLSANCQVAGCAAIFDLPQSGRWQTPKNGQNQRFFALLVV